MIAMLLLAAASPASLCAPLPGADALVRQSRVKWLMLGEMHGTAEMPVAATDIVCAAAVRRRPVTVAVEQTVANQPMIDAFLASDGGRSARAAFAAAPMWHQTYQDGRSSTAMAALFERLRLLHRTGKVARVVAIDPDVSTGSADRNAQMARNLRALRPRSGDLVVALIGGLHAQNGEIVTPDGRWPSTASLLPAAETTTVMMIGSAGSAWVCLERCGPQPVGEPRTAARGVNIRPPTADLPFDATLELGSATTASPPWTETN